MVRFRGYYHNQHNKQETHAIGCVTHILKCYYYQSIGLPKSDPYCICYWHLVNFMVNLIYLNRFFVVNAIGI